MMSTWVSGLVLLLTLVQAAPPQRAAVSPQTFVGTWVGTQSWAIDSPPPGARQDQPVSLTIDLVDGKITGTMTPFMGGQDGATFVDVQIVGDELRVVLRSHAEHEEGRLDVELVEQIEDDAHLAGEGGVRRVPVAGPGRPAHQLAPILEVEAEDEPAEPVSRGRCQPFERIPAGYPGSIGAR